MEVEKERKEKEEDKLRKEKNKTNYRINKEEIEKEKEKYKKEKRKKLDLVINDIILYNSLSMKTNIGFIINKDIYEFEMRNEHQKYIIVADNRKFLFHLIFFLLININGAQMFDKSEINKFINN